MFTKIRSVSNCLRAQRSQFAFAARLSVLGFAALAQLTALQAQSNYATLYTITTLAGTSPFGSTDGTGTTARFYAPTGVAMDSSGNVYVADSKNFVIRKITFAGVVTTFAGSAGDPDWRDGTGSAARFYSPADVAVDETGNVYVADFGAIRKITAAGVVTTLAGNALVSGSVDGTGSAAEFRRVKGFAVDGAGNVYLADSQNSTIRKVTSTGVVTTLAGTSGTTGSADGTGSAGRFNHPQGVALDGTGNIYVADSDNCTIRKITTAGVVTTLAGMPGSYGSIDGTGSNARFSSPQRLAVDGEGNIWATDGNLIRKITSGGVVTTFAGMPDEAGSADGTGSSARFRNPQGVAVDGNNNIYVTDTENNTIRKISAGAVVTTFAGAVIGGSADGTGSAARFSSPSSVAVDGADNVYVADTGNQTIRKITVAGVVTTLAGTPGGYGSADGTGSMARFNAPQGVAVNGGGVLYVADTYNHTIRKITPAGVVTLFAGSTASPGSDDGTGGAARFKFPTSVAVDGSGNVYVADHGNSTIRKITAAGNVTTLAGTPGLTGSDDGTGTEALFNQPIDVAVDGYGNVYVSDNHTIRKITSTGIVTTLAGMPGLFGTTDGFGSAARLYEPKGVATDEAGNVYVMDSGASTIRKITPTGVVTTLAGTSFSVGSTDGTGSAARFNFPSGIAVDSIGTVYVADQTNNTIRKGVLFSGLTVTAPIDQTIPPGQNTAFTVSVSGTPSPSGYQWQRLAAGGGTWSNLSNGGSYGGTATETLLVGNVTPIMDGDLFRCVVTNSVGKVGSDAALLDVIAPPSDAIITITVQ